MWSYWVFALGFLAQTKFTSVDAANILFFHVVGTPSHRSSIWPLAARLADVGHNVTYIFPLHRRPGSHPAVKEFVASKMVEEVDTFLQSCEINHRLNHTLDQWMFESFERIPKFCGDFYDSPETQELMANPETHFDLILMDGGFGQCAYGLVHHFGAKHILFQPVILPFLYDSFGVVPSSSSVPDWIFSPKTSDLMNSLWSRTLNALAPFIWRVMFTRSMHKVETVVREKMHVSKTNEMPSFLEIEQETSLVLHNTYFIEDHSLSLPPMFVSYSGLLCSEKERLSRMPLPEKMESFLNDTENSGFVYISFGSSVQIHTMPETLRNEFMSLFQSFPNLKFLWKWNGPVPKDTPQNVLLHPWFPQQDVLAHPKIKAFMTQVGRPSTQEALCFGVPIIGIPMFADQTINADKLEYLGVAVHLSIDTLTKDTLIQAVKEITENDRYKSKAAELSAMFRDRPMDPLDNIQYWVEYVLRHNTTLLKPLAMKQPWWQRRLLDVYALLLIMLLGLLGLCILVGYWVIKITVRALAPSSRNKRNKKQD